MKRRFYRNADTNSIKATLNIYKNVMGDERKYFYMSIIFIPLQHLLYIVVLPLLASMYVQHLITNPQSGIDWWLVGGMVLCGALSLVFARIGFTVFFNHEERMTTKLTQHTMDKLLNHSYKFFANTETGSLAGDVNTFTRSYLGLMDTMLLQASAIIVNFVASLVIIAFIAPLMLPAMLLLTIVVVGLALRSYHMRSDLRMQRKELQSQIMGLFGDIIGNQTLVRMFGRKQYEINSITHKRKGVEEIAKKENRILEDGAELRLGFLIAFQIVVLVLCGWFLAKNLLTIAALVFVVTYLGRITGSLFAINSIIRMSEQAFLDAAKITEILAKSPDVTDLPDAQVLQVTNGVIDIKTMNFAYKDSKNDIVFDNLNVHIRGSQAVGLAGKSGGGKSTLTHLLLRYMDIQHGNIKIDGQDISEVTQDSLRAHIAYVPQDPFLFHRSLRENIAYGKPDATDDEIIRAAKKAYAMEFIEKLPNGLDTIVGERGVKLSGGQRQRVAIARAILKDAPILILDEATSALDSESEVYIQKALAELMEGRTSIVIAHRLSTIARLDRIIVLDDGKIIEDGTHAELLKKGGTYATLWNHQSGGFIED